MNAKDFISHFYESLPLFVEPEGDTDTCLAHYLDLLNTVSAIFEETVYVVDFRKCCFRYVSGKGLFLGNYTPYQILQMGFDYYPMVIHPSDYDLISKIYQEVMRLLIHPATPIHDLSNIVFDFKLKGFKDKLILCHKIMPLIVNGKVQMVVCCVSSSTNTKSGNLIAYYLSKKDICYHYSIIRRQWEQMPLIQVSPLEMNILKYSKLGLSDKVLAEVIGRSYQTVKNYKNNIYRKFGVNSMIQAFIFTNNHRIHIQPELQHE